ncbi:MAG: twin transmembrane helix small protein [Lautropia sp.]
MKPLIIAAFVLIFASLGGAGYFMLRDRGRTRNTAWALTMRISLSVALFLLILFAHWMGWIRSTGLPVGGP